MKFILRRLLKIQGNTYIIYFSLSQDSLLKTVSVLNASKTIDRIMNKYLRILLAWHHNKTNI